MKSKIPSDKDLKLFCEEVGPGDGIPSRLLDASLGRKPNKRKARQLCKQVEQSISIALATEFDDPVYGQFMVDRVEPGGDANHIIVVFRPVPGIDFVEEAVALQSLAKVKGQLRSEVAASITRKRVPELSFRFLPTGPVLCE
jgi:ribosome-binding factor A